MLAVFDRLDHSVAGPADNSEAITESIDRLVVPRHRLDAAGTHHVGNQGAGVDRDGMRADLAQVSAGDIQFELLAKLDRVFELAKPTRARSR